MDERLLVTGISAFEGQVNDVMLDEQRDVRLVFRPKLVVHDDSPDAKLNGRLVRQRRHSRTNDWEDCDGFNLKTMKFGEEVQLYLDADTLFRLHEELKKLYALPLDWTFGKSKEYVALEKDAVYIATGREKELLEELINREGTKIWELLDELGPGMVQTVALRRQHIIRTQAVAEFEEHMDRCDWSENDWQLFFENNEWIFGHNLIFQFVNKVSDQAHLGGTTISGKGAQRIDMVIHTEAHARFTVLVDIKKPNTELVGPEPYRNKAYPLGTDLVGGCSQLQSYCRTWVTDGSRQEDNVRLLHGERISTYEPRGVLVVGNSAQLDDEHKKATFELFRRNLHNPEIITYDELLERARFTVRLDALC
jgi:hypothetical protein